MSMMSYSKFAVRYVLPAVSMLLLAVFPSLAFGAPPSPALKFYFIDVEGGQATLIVTPDHKSMLIDTGYPGFHERDVERIIATTKQAGLDHLDYLLITHYHIDHVGNAVDLARKIPITTFLDHGPNQENAPDTEANYAAYEKLASAHQHRILKPGDEFDLGEAKIAVVSSAGNAITRPLTGAGDANPLCSSEPAAETDPTENAQSVGILLTFGKFRFLDLGDLTKKKELALACPKNLIGRTDLFLTTHHGLDFSNARALVHALRPRVAIMNNGPHKGGSPAAWQIVHDSPGIEALWQLHYSVDADAAHNSKEALIANTSENCQGKEITVDARKDGTFTVTNSRNGYAQTYGK